MIALILFCCFVIVWVLGALGTWAAECLVCKDYETDTLLLSLFLWWLVVIWQVNDVAFEIRQRRQAKSRKDGV